MSPPPIVWSIAGTDSGGGAGLAADQRAAEALGVHLCPVVAAVTAQNSRAVTRTAPMAPDLIDAQLEALADDMPPVAVKTGLLGGAAQIRVVARWIDRLRDHHGAVALVVDPVLGASSGARFADDEALRAYRDELLPRATLLTPNRREAAALAGGDDAVPALAGALRAAGAQAVCITGGDAGETLALDWLDCNHARGWLALPRVLTRHGHGTGCTYATSAAAAFALGFVAADAAVIAKMSTTHALRRARAAGAGAGPVIAASGACVDPGLLPTMSFGTEPPAWPSLGGQHSDTASPGHDTDRLGIYALVDSIERLQAALDAGVRTVQLRIKVPPTDARLRDAVQRGVAACRRAGARLFVNDHWRLALEFGAYGVHLGQEDLLALDEAERRAIASRGLALGVSSHSLWELARARSLSPAYIACGPVWPTSTKSMPWRPQGTDNLAWWCAVAATPVVAIGGILTPDQVRRAARAGADGVCVVRGLGDDPRATVAPLQAAFAEGRATAAPPAPRLPHPSLARA